MTWPGTKKACARQGCQSEGLRASKPCFARRACRSEMSSGRTVREKMGREELTAAMDMYREMEMTFWLEKAEAALAGV